MKRCGAVALSVLVGGTASAVDGTLVTAPSTPLSGTYHEIRVHVEIEAGETSIVSTWLESRSPSQPSDELDIEEFLPPMEPPPYAVVPEAELFCKFDSTHWKHGETVEFWLYATVWHNGQMTSVEPQLITTRTVYNAAVVFQHKQLSLGASGSGAGLGLMAWNHKLTQNVVTNGWTAAQYATGIGPATSHFVLAHGTPGEIHPPVEPPAIDDGVVQGGVPSGPFPLYFAFLASCRIAESGNDALPNAYLSEATGTTNRCVIAFKFSIENAEAVSMFLGIVERVLDGEPVEKAAIATWTSMGLVTKYGSFASHVHISGDRFARPRWLYDGTDTTHTDWKRNP